MPAFPDPRAPPPVCTAEIVSLAELNRARTRRVLAQDADGPVERHPWAYAFPRPLVGLGAPIGAHGKP